MQDHRHMTADAILELMEDNGNQLRIARHRKLAAWMEAFERRGESLGQLLAKRERIEADRPTMVGRLL